MSRGLRAGLLLAVLAVMAAAPASALGARQVKILGGGIAAPGQFPWLASLVDSGTRSALAGEFCGGTVIAPRVILTAGHCVQGTRAAQIDVVTGRTRLSDAATGQRIRVAKIVRHPGYVDSTTANDLALLQLSTPTTAPAVTLTGAADTAIQATGQPVTVAGWGVTSQGGRRASDEQRFVRLSLVAPSVCNRRFGDVNVRRTLCAGSKRAGEDSCQGDSGGPLFSGTDATARMVGIVSFGDGCGKANVPGVYTKVSAFTAWIAEQSAILNGTAPAPPPAVQAPRVRIGHVGCGPTTCTVSLRLSGRAPAGGIVLNVVRRRSGSRKAVDRFVLAKRVSGGRWRARTGLPYGRLTLYAIPLNAAQDDLDGSGDVARVEIVPG